MFVMVFVVETISRPISLMVSIVFFQQGLLTLKSWQLLWELNMLRSMLSNKNWILCILYVCILWVDDFVWILECRIDVQN